MGKQLPYTENREQLLRNKKKSRTISVLIPFLFYFSFDGKKAQNFEEQVGKSTVKYHVRREFANSVECQSLFFHFFPHTMHPLHISKENGRT